MTSRFQAAVRRRLHEIADPAVALGYTRYFKHVVHFIGVRTPEFRRIAREEMSRLTSAPIEEVISDAFALLSSRGMEERQIGVLVLQKYVLQLPDDIVKRLAPIVDTHVGDWGTCDAIAGHVLRHLIQRDPSFVRDVVSWSASPQLWRQRASAVSFVNLARRGHHTKEILEVCDRVVYNPERFAQLGMGWVLRELFLAEPEIVLAFLRRHLTRVSREGLRYAIEKMPVPVQRRLLDEHQAANARSHAPPAAGAAAVGNRSAVGVRQRGSARRDTVTATRRASRPNAPAEVPTPRSRPRPRKS
jgi:3-methyladenine DNA glycosylase AlkD